MPRPANPHPTDGEIEILRVLWIHGPTSLGGLCDELRKERPVVATTAATMLRLMADKGLVKRTGSGRGAQWSALANQQQTERGMVRRLVDRLFGGAADRLVAHLVEGGELSDKQLGEIRAAIKDRKKTPVSQRKKKSS